ncbi:MAG: Permeases of the drug/metabolite transporter (DMT) superfamily [Candidatus Ozemobacter sibiricus]|uniref:Permeases of the drug/metabolite transporter (DMT) superfamily n=1 Tax=Candidatus Ozemobacter sibiricus TaxID=2268124 RepID=A0A367ZD34_9BACT|nr:MAG: Permeases of the drug/metabolite transporter (DMT) superfamily [Candidatus Ozemobacter sibiricus]
MQVAVAAGLWGAAYPLTKGALASLPAISLGFARFALASGVLMALTRSGPLAGIAPEDRRAMGWLAFWGTFVLVLGMNFGLRWAPGIASSIISGTPPLFTIILAAIWWREPWQGRQFIAVGLALLGLFLLAGDAPATVAQGPEYWLGLGLVTVPQIAWAIYGLLGKAVIARYPWTAVCRDTFALGALMLAPFAAVEAIWLGLGTWGSRELLTLLYLGVCNSVVTYGLWNSALAMIPVATASFVLYLQPISGAILSAVLFGERLGSAGLLGTLLIFAALALVLRPGPTSPHEEPAPAP